MTMNQMQQMQPHSRDGLSLRKNLADGSITNEWAMLTLDSRYMVIAALRQHLDRCDFEKIKNDDNGNNVNHDPASLGVIIDMLEGDNPIIRIECEMCSRNFTAHKYVGNRNERRTCSNTCRLAYNKKHAANSQRLYRERQSKKDA